jgi:exodeoxyribonuclease VII large subunit
MLHSNLMPQPSLIPVEAVFSVGEYLDLVNGLLQPAKLTVQGEVTQVQERGSAVYFTLSDPKQKATLSALIWKDKLWKSGVDLRVGEEYACVGAGNVYKPFGKLSFMAETLTPVGEGALQQAFEKLKKQLEQEGYFSLERKRQLPSFIEHIAVISSAQGDAIRDFRTHVGQFGQHIEFIDVRVEGVNAIPSIVQALTWVASRPERPQVVVVTRGGGSLESLQAFNSREVAEAIFRSPIPVISAIGHERDITISDLVADIRASTPTDAGKILSRDWSQASERLGQTQQAIIWRLDSLLRTTSEKLDHLPQRWIHRFTTVWQQQQQRVALAQSLGKSIHVRFVERVQQKEAWVEQWQRRWLEQHQDAYVQLEAYSQSLVQWFSHSLAHSKNAVRVQQEYFDAVSPERRLAQGYVWMRNDEGKVIRSTTQVKAGQPLQITLKDGMINSTIDSIETKTKE